MEIHPDIKLSLARWIPRLPANWSVLYLDYSIEHYFPEQSHAHGIPSDCIDAFAGQTIVKLHGLCSSGSTRSMVISHQGARLLYEHAIPIWRNADVFLRDMIYHGVIDAYAILPILATGMIAIADRNASQMNMRSLKWDGDHVFVTHAVGDDIDCAKELCYMQFRASSE